MDPTPNSAKAEKIDVTRENDVRKIHECVLESQLLERELSYVAEKYTKELYFSAALDADRTCFLLRLVNLCIMQMVDFSLFAVYYKTVIRLSETSDEKVRVCALECYYSLASFIHPRRFKVFQNTEQEIKI